MSCTSTVQYHDAMRFETRISLGKVNYSKCDRPAFLTSNTLKFKFRADISVVNTLGSHCHRVWLSALGNNISLSSFTPESTWSYFPSCKIAEFGTHAICTRWARLLGASGGFGDFACLILGFETACGLVPTHESDVSPQSTQNNVDPLKTGMRIHRKVL